MRRLLLISLLAALSLGVRAAAPLQQEVFDPAFRTLKTSSARGFLDLPVIQLGSGEEVVISFDEIADDRSYLRYRLVHCNADWQPSQLQDQEYVEGFNLGDVDDYAFSSNTFVHYVNYRIVIPNDQVAPTVSGNYVLQVFDEYEPGNVLLQARFMVDEGGAEILGRYSAVTDLGVNDRWQQLEFAVALTDRSVRDPFRDLIVVVDKNSEPENTRIIERPLRQAGEKLVYEHLPDLVFPAGNEYRRFETVRATYPGLHTDSVRYGGTNYHAYLMRDEGRDAKPYAFDSTQNGRFLVREYNSTDSDLGADYVTVHFQLYFPEILDADIYVDGEMTGRLLRPANRMDYDRDTYMYTLELPLKQGSYNYRYVAAPRLGKGAPSASPVEGDKFETRNEYHVYVYHRALGSRADRLIGHTTIR